MSINDDVGHCCEVGGKHPYSPLVDRPGMAAGDSDYAGMGDRSEGLGAVPETARERDAAEQEGDEVPRIGGIA